MNGPTIYEVLETMPPLKHCGDQPENSEVVKWLTTKPELQKWLFRKAVWSGRIRYDAQAGRWIGVGKEEGKRKDAARLELRALKKQAKEQKKADEKAAVKERRAKEKEDEQLAMNGVITAWKGSGLGYAELGKRLGVSTTTAWKLDRKLNMATPLPMSLTTAVELE